ncbi:MAG: sigma-54-dependent Fis family transcriptional regulator [Candidatus Scalindua sp. AMX11]|nr:MAG: sigma-54-dependent Fis family transcriptional regulator [Candidatus Scalindua sp.]NOG82406.1 sigma-54-dependent Fis family transcriptional regulator [Planctomycetota bacterium]RZV70237.1 MAG: sigma-54-dependent Fis family transcriptional regulator [Candidatus Scalindua sp. SCAELEC01]TDE64050.1 MAG: sigma-54-dependent Fis family transcriptional regulator [Candidatus Scalindua sp. AMX11]GJQ60125.1 MAG: acetoacetate metabolism regulatory protein AtoC [Candidatus Scalindua sp.]
MRKPRLLLIDDDVNTVNGLKTLLSRSDYDTSCALTGRDALKMIERIHFDIVITDMKLPDIGGFTIIEEIKRKDANTSVVMITAYSSIQTAIDAMKKGADHYLTKPVNIDELELILGRIWEKQLLILQNRELKQKLDEKYNFHGLIGDTTEMQQIFKTISEIAPTTATVLIYGATGTGKELIANAIHHNSDRKEKSFVALHCASLSEGVLESELFGHEKGAFTGAMSQRRGRFELADGGSLFLDEIGELSSHVQIKLLRVLETGCFERVGGENSLNTDVRIIAATNKDLEKEVEKGTFREDLYYRLNVINLLIPPLKERRDDIALLADCFLIKYSKKNKKNIKGFLPQTMRLLNSYDWPGNVRELENIVERAVVMAKKDLIEPDNLPSKISLSVKQANRDVFSIPFGTSLRDAERKIITETLQATNGSKSKAAKILGISTRKIEYKHKEWSKA